MPTPLHPPHVSTRYAEPLRRLARKQCERCRSHRALFWRAGRVKAARLHRLCIRCWRPAISRLQASLHTQEVDHAS